MSNHERKISIIEHLLKETIPDPSALSQKSVGSSSENNWQVSCFAGTENPYERIIAHASVRYMPPRIELYVYFLTSHTPDLSLA